MSREDDELVGGERLLDHGSDERLEVLAAAPVRRPAPAGHDLLGAGGLVDPDQLLEREPQVADVEIVGDRVVDLGVPRGVDRDPAVAALANQADQRRRVIPGAHAALVLLPRPPGDGACEQPGRRLRRLDEEAVPTARVGELV
jgi:hypothetical protein